MFESLLFLFDTADFPARWYCGKWTTVHGLTHIIADFAIAAAYAAIPMVLAFFILRRRDTPFLPVFWLFAAFILSCGIGHFAEAIIFWNPWYRFSALIKVCTATVSWATVIALIRVVPKALTLPGLAAVNSALSAYAAKLEFKNKELDQFAYIASHDLTEPLRSVKNLSSWIAKDLGETNLPAATSRHLVQMREQIERMETLLAELLEYSRAGRLDPKIDVVDLGQTIHDMLPLWDIPDKFQVTVEDPMPTVMTARVPLETCVRNLISNAIKHHDRPDGQVRVSAQDCGEFVEVRVADDGPGIAPQHQARIFEIFQTLRSRDDHQSAGMGLALVKKIVETHGGTVELRSSEGDGAEFILMWRKEMQDLGSVS